MNIVCLFGSPRPKGNSAAIAKRFCERAREEGATVRSFSLNKLTYRGCQGCLTCKTKLDRCVLEDDLTDVLDAVRDADLLLMASPVYYGEVSSQLKGFIDRTFSYLVSDYTTNPNPSRLKPGKKLVMVLAQGEPEEQNFADIFPRYESFFRWYGFYDNHLIRACGVFDKGAAEQRADIMQSAENLARKLTAR